MFRGYYYAVNLCHVYSSHESLILLQSLCSEYTFIKETDYKTSKLVIQYFHIQSGYLLIRYFVRTSTCWSFYK